MNEEEKPEVKINEYLKTPKAFHLEMPLYEVFDLSDETISEIIYEWLKYSDTLDAYCIWCEKDSVFDTEEHLYSNIFLYEWRNSSGFRRNTYKCSRNANHKYYAYYLKTGNDFLKIGQWPSVADFQIPQAEKYRKLLGEEQYKELTRGIGLFSHGVGIGSFVYLRRIFENLIENAHIETKKKNQTFSEEVYLRVKMDEKIKMVKDQLPEFLVDNRVLYGIMSKGIHELTEKECLKYFETVKIGIEQILDEKIVQKENEEKAVRAREAIQKTFGELSK